jgi:hypothetical protein
MAQGKGTRNIPGSTAHRAMQNAQQPAAPPAAPPAALTFRSGGGPTTRIGYESTGGQRCHGTLGVPGTDHGQFAFKLECTHCGCVYGANGSDIHLRNCPACQGGAPGIRYWLDLRAGERPT